MVCDELSMMTIYFGIGNRPASESPLVICLIKIAVMLDMHIYT